MTDGLAIGQVGAFVGVAVKTVRTRDSSSHRRYGS